MEKVKLIQKDYPVISGIYKLDFPNGKCYIGQAKNIYKRILDHNRYANQGHGNHNIQVCEKAIQKYGNIEEFYVLEEVNDFTKLDEKESYWIKYYNSTIKNNGYNIVETGNASGKSGIENSNAVFNEQTLQEVIDLLQNHNEISLIDISKKYNVDQNTIVRINTGKSYINSKLDYPIRKQKYSGAKKELLDYFNSEQELLQLKEDLLYRWDLMIETDLHNKYNIPIALIRDINNGRKFQQYGEYIYPIRKKNSTNKINLSIQQVKEILNLLKNTKTSIVQIAIDYKISRNTIYKINKGETCRIKNFNYPAR